MSSVLSRDSFCVLESTQRSRFWPFRHTLSSNMRGRCQKEIRRALRNLPPFSKAYAMCAVCALCALCAMCEKQGVDRLLQLREGRKKSRTNTMPGPAAHHVAGGEVLVAVMGASLERGELEKEETCYNIQITNKYNKQGVDSRCSIRRGPRAPRAAPGRPTRLSSLRNSPQSSPPGPVWLWKKSIAFLNRREGIIFLKASTFSKGTKSIRLSAALVAYWVSSVRIHIHAENLVSWHWIAKILQGLTKEVTPNTKCTFAPSVIYLQKAASRQPRTSHMNEYFRFSKNNSERTRNSSAYSSIQPGTKTYSFFIFFLCFFLLH